MDIYIWSNDVYRVYERGRPHYRPFSVCDLQLKLETCLMYYHSNFHPRMQTKRRDTRTEARPRRAVQVGMANRDLIGHRLLLWKLADAEAGNWEMGPK